MSDSSDPPEDDDHQNSVDLLKAMMVIAAMYPAYCRAMTNAILADAEHAGNPHLANDQNFKRLFYYDAMMALFLIWRTSAYLRDAACEEAGVERADEQARLNCNTLGTAALNDLYLPPELAKKMGVEGYIMNMRRIVDAAIRFGFAVKLEGRANLKPLDATEALHLLMMDTIREYKNPSRGPGDGDGRGDDDKDNGNDDDGTGQT